MIRSVIVMAVLLLPTIALTQTATGKRPAATPKSGAYRPAVPSASTTNVYGGGYGSTGGASTAAGSAMNGMASVISAQGDYNLSTSAAAVNMTQAQKNEIENRQQWTNTYFEMRATNRAAVAAERGPRPSMEQLARMAHEAAPKPMGPGDVDPITGKLRWPDVLQDDRYNDRRGELDELAAKQAYQGGLNFSEQMTARKAIEAMFGKLKGQIREVPPQQYIASKNFLQSMIYSMTKSQLN